jgi:hypothetical protein
MPIKTILISSVQFFPGKKSYLSTKEIQGRCACVISRKETERRGTDRETDGHIPNCGDGFRDAFWKEGRKESGEQCNRRVGEKRKYTE